MQIWSWLRKAVPIMVIATMLASAIGAFPVMAATGTKVAFIGQPNTTVANTNIPAIIIEVQDAGGARDTTSTASITLAIDPNPSGGTLLGTTTVNASGGLATFNNVRIDKPGTGYTLIASSSGLTGATSVAFDIIIGPAAKLAFTVSPPTTAAGANITPAVTVTVEDAANNLVTSSTATIVIALSANPGSGTLSGTKTVDAVAGVATFNDLNIDKPGTGYRLSASSSPLTGATSSLFNIIVGAAAKLAFTVQPSATQTYPTVISPAVRVTVQDIAGNTVTTSTASIGIAIGTNPVGGTLTGTTPVSAVAGVATFSDLSINNVGVGYTLVASSAGLTGATSNAFTIYGPAAKLAFIVQPSNTAAGANITPAVTVAIQDTAGNTVVSSTASIALVIGTNPASGTLTGTTPVAAVAGVATFSNLNINNAGTAYTLSASSSGLTPASSGSFNITIGIPTKLVISAQPSTTNAGATMAPVTVTVQDSSNNTVISSTASITL